MNRRALGGVKGLQRLAVRLRLLGDVWLWRHGWAWPLLGVFVVSGAAAWVWAAHEVAQEMARTQRLQPQAAALTQAGAGEAASTPHAPAGEPAANAPPGDPLREHTALSDEVRLLYALAAREQIPVLQVDFADSASGGLHHAAMRRLEIALPVQTTYPQLRRFIEAGLREIPNASLDRMSFRRTQVSSPIVDVEMRWSLWSLAGDPTGAAPVVESVEAAASSSRSARP